MNSEMTQQGDSRVLRVSLVITRGERGGAQVHVLELLRGLASSVDYDLVVGEEGFLADEARALGVPVAVLPELQRAIAPGRDLAAARLLRQHLLRQRPQLVHTHSTKAGLLGRLAARLVGIPAIHTAHSWAFSDGIAWQRKAFAIPSEAVAARWTERFIVVSAADREVGLRYGVARDDQVRIVHNGVADHPRRAVPGRPGTPVIVMVARMAPPKDHALLLRALADVDLPFQLRLVGDGPQEAQVRALLAELGLGDRVQLLGRRSDVAEQLADADLAVLVSRQEGFPLAVLEAMRSGLPVVASDVGGVREAVDHGVTGLLVPRDDQAALRDGLARLLADPALRQRFGEAGRAAYDARFTVDTMLDGTLAVYRELARARGCSAAAAGRTAS